MSTLVLGIGNTLLTDEGAGVHAANFLENNYGSLPQTTVVDGGTLSFTLLGLINDHDNLIVIDAAQLCASPGHIRTFIGPAMDQFIYNGKKQSVHEVGLADLFAMTTLTGSLPKNRALIAVQPENMQWGEQPSQRDEKAIPEICKQAAQLIEEWE